MADTIVAKKAGPDSKVAITPAQFYLFPHRVSKRKGSAYRSGRSPDWLKMKNPNASAVTREADEEWER
jgi:hypothetical protein